LQELAHIIIKCCQIYDNVNTVSWICVSTDKKYMNVLISTDTAPK